MYESKLDKIILSKKERDAIILFKNRGVYMENKEICVLDQSEKYLKILRVVAIITTIACMIMIFNFSADPAVKSSKLSSKVVDYFCMIVYRFTGKNPQVAFSMETMYMLEYFFRKLAHMTIYFLLSMNIMLVLFTFNMKMYIRIFLTFLLSYGYACSDEFHQSFVVGRGPSFQDTLIDGTGAIIGIMIALIIYCIIYTLYYRHISKKALDFKHYKTISDQLNNKENV